MKTTYITREFAEVTLGGSLPPSGGVLRCDEMRVRGRMLQRPAGGALTKGMPERRLWLDVCEVKSDVHLAILTGGSLVPFVKGSHI